MPDAKRLSLEEFEEAAATLSMNARTRAIAKRVLVHGHSQADLAQHYGVTAGAISQSVGRVWKAHQAIMPRGFERLEVLLLTARVPLVRQWDSEARELLDHLRKERKRRSEAKVPTQRAKTRSR